MKLLPVYARLVTATVGVLALVSEAGAQEAEPPPPAQEEAAPREAAEQASAQQEGLRLFVTDKLVLNVYSEPAQGGERVATIETGDVVEELERADNFVRVRIAGGREGWVGSNYLTADPPAAVRLRELQRQQKAAAPVIDKRSTEELARLRKQNAALESELKVLKENAAAHAAPPPGETQTFDDLEDAPSAAIATTEGSTSGGGVLLALLAAAAAGLIGFAAGYHMLARRIRQKFGGLKIY